MIAASFHLTIALGRMAGMLGRFVDRTESFLAIDTTIACLKTCKDRHGQQTHPRKNNGNYRITAHAISLLKYVIDEAHKRQTDPNGISHQGGWGNTKAEGSNHPV